jgi:hypothetical protein
VFTASGDDVISLPGTTVLGATLIDSGPGNDVEP